MPSNKLGRNRLNGLNPLAYMGSADADASAPLLWFNRAPTASDYKNFLIGTLWIDTSPVAPADPEVYILCRKEAGSSTWVHLNQATSDEIVTITGDNDVAVASDVLDNVNIVSNITGFSLDGNAGTSTLTMNNFGGGPFLETITGDVGGAIEPDGVDANINLLGGTNIETTGAINTIIIDFVGPLPVSEGGTGATALTDHALLVGSGTGSITSLTVANDGEIPIGSSGNDPVLSTITAGTNISILNGPGSIIISSTGGGPSSRTAWVPGLSFSGGTTGLVLGAQDGWYIEFDDVIFYYGHIQVTNRGTSSGDVRIENLPFTAVAGIEFIPGNVLAKYVSFLQGGTLYCYPVGGQNYLNIAATLTLLAPDVLRNININTNPPTPSEFWFSGFYFRA